jgi:hypothetical protein
MIRYPAGTITPHGAYYLKTGILPNVSYVSGDETAQFNLLGGAAIPDPTMPEAVAITSLKGLIPPWQNIEQKGSTQDGSSYITSLYDPLDVEIGIRVRGRDPIWTRRVVHDWVDSWDAKIPGKLIWSTLEQADWWATAQLGKTPIEAFTGGMSRTNEQKFAWLAKAYNAFWMTTDDIDYLQGNGTKFLTRLNVGDQSMFDVYTCVGPGTFYFQDGPGSSNYVAYGPLSGGQAVQIRTDPRKRSVVPLYGTFQVTRHLGPFSVGRPFAVNPYSLLQGRFSDNAGIPRKPSGTAAARYYVAVTISGGDSGSTIIAAGTPLRRMPF